MIFLLLCGILLIQVVMFLDVSFFSSDAWRIILYISAVVFTISSFYAGGRQLFSSIQQWRELKKKEASERAAIVERENKNDSK